MTGGMRYVSSLLRPFLAQQPHLLRDSHDLLCQLRGIAVLENDRFLKIDIKYYFMSGEHHHLIRHSSQAIECPVSRQAYATLLGAILRNQLISVEGVANRLRVDNTMGHWNGLALFGGRYRHSGPLHGRGELRNKRRG